ncbi:MAG: hypothetical protein ABSE92_17900 [Terriglobales bacterium]
MTLGLIVFAGAQTPAGAQNRVIAPAFLPQGSVGEKPYALLFVTVWGPDNRAVNGVKVRVRRADQKKPHWEVYSDRRGEAAQRLPPGPGDYVVSADTKGIKDANGKELQAGEDVNVHFDKEERQDIGLHLK